MKKIYILLIIPFILLFAIPCSGTDVSNEIAGELNDELDNFQNTLPDYVKDFFQNEALSSDYSKLLGDSLNEKDFLSLTIDYLTAGLSVTVKSFAEILLLLIITGIFNTLKSSAISNSTGFSFAVLSTLSISLSVFKIIASLAESSITYITTLSNVMNSFTPIMIGISIMTGSTSSAIISSSSMLLFISFIESFLVKFMVPLVTTCLCFGCISSLTSSCDFSGISKTIKTTFSSVTVFTMSVFMFVFSYKSTLAKGVDTLSIKTARFAISSFVPLVGASVNDALKSVTASLSLVKSTSGTIGIIAIIVLMLPIIIHLFLNKLSFSILSSVSKLLGAENTSGILNEADGICSFLLTLVASTCVLFIFALTIFINTGVSIGE